MADEQMDKILEDAARAERCDRAELVIGRAVAQGWITVHNRAQLKATLRIALDTEVRAGGPFSDRSGLEQ